MPLITYLRYYINKIQILKAYLKTGKLLINKSSVEETCH